MVNFKRWLNILWIIPITLLIYWTDLLPKDEVGEISQSLWYKFGGIISGGEENSSKVFLVAIQQLYFLIIYNILFANYIVDNFKYSCIYVFSRVENKNKWFLKNAVELFCTSAIYSLAFIITLFFISLVGANFYFTIEDIKVAIIFWFKICILCYNTTLIVNLISIRFGSVISFIYVYGTVALIIMLSFEIANTEIMQEHPILNIFNPVNGILQELVTNIKFQSVFVLYNFGIIIITVITGMLYINKLDIALVNIEDK